MDRENFVEKIIERVRDSVLNSMILNLEKPAGKSPDKKLMEMSKWFNKLSLDDKGTLSKVIQDTIDETVFSFLCILDGSRNIGIDGELELFHKEGTKITKINKGDTDLHDIYLSLTQKEK